MKRICCLLFVLLLLTGCASNEPSHENSGNYLYTQIRGVLHKISPYSATIAPMCPDPLCKHNSADCHFFGIDEMSVQTDGTYMYYLKDRDSSRKIDSCIRLCAFDMANASFEVLYEAKEGVLYNLLVAERYLYFLGLQTKDGKTLCDIYRMEHGSHKAERLTAQPLEQQPFLYCSRDGRIYWQEESGAYYSTDESYGDRRDGDSVATAINTIGNNAYLFERAGFDSESFTDLQKIIRVDTETGKESVLFESLGCTPVFFGGQVIYAKLGEPKLLGYTLDEETGEKQLCYDKFGGKYYICDPDGKNERLLCDLKGSGCAILEHPMIIGGRGVGDWYVTQAYHYTEPNEESVIERDGNVYLLINIKTGEWKVASIETRS